MSAAIHIDFKLPEFEPRPELVEYVRRLVGERALAMGLDRECSLHVCITNDENFATAVSERSPGSSITENAIYSAVGKSIPIIEFDTCVGDHVILKSSVIESFVSPTHSNLQGELDAFRYVLAHEIGHCVDHSRRIQQHRVHRWGALDDQERELAIHTDIIVGEYAACYFSANFLSHDGFCYLVDETQESISKLAETDLPSAWICLMQAAKIAAYTHANQQLGRSCSFSIWPDSLKLHNSISNFATKLEAAWCQYPACQIDFEEAVAPALETLVK
jgi:hypothetical protein